MKYLVFGVAALIACGAPTDMKRLAILDFGDEARVVHPKIVRVTVTPVTAVAYAGTTVQYVATARDGEGRLLRPSSWKWTTSDSTIAVVTQTGLATGRAAGQGIIAATAYPPFRK
jgi:hypothetical protein